MPPPQDPIAAKQRLVAKPPRATKIGPQPKPSTGDKILHTLTGVPNPRTMPFEEPTGPADVLMAAAPLAGGFKYLSGLADALPKTSPARVYGKLKGLNTVRTLPPELQATIFADASMAPTGGVTDMALLKAYGPAILSDILAPQTRRTFLRNALGTRGRIKELNGLRDMQRYAGALDDLNLYDGWEPGPEWYGRMLREHKDAVNMMGGARRQAFQSYDPQGNEIEIMGLVPKYPDEYLGMPKIHAYWEGPTHKTPLEAAIEELDPGRAAQEIARNPSIIGERIRRILGLKVENEAAPLRESAKLLEGPR